MSHCPFLVVEGVPNVPEVVILGLIGEDAGVLEEGAFKETADLPCPIRSSRPSESPRARRCRSSRGSSWALSMRTWKAS